MKRPTLARSLTLTLAALSLLTVETTAAESTKAEIIGEPNPAAAGFLADESDAEAIALADRVMLRMGGHTAWNTTRFVTWRFFGNRFHVWDKHTGNIRVEGKDRETQKTYLVLMNLQTKSGRAWESGVEVTNPEAKAELLDLGESAWINDSYWMFMPYKLKDTGVALEHFGERALLDGRMADLLGLTFRDVGRTPENRYEIYVAKDTGLVEQWDFFTQASDSEPRFQVPWRNWRRHGSILLSDDRGRGQHTDIAVFDSVPDEIFTDPKPVGLSVLESATTGNLAEAPIYSVDGNVVKPVKREASLPQYTEVAAAAGIEGPVVVRTVIGSNGSVRDAWVVQPLDDGLDQEALNAVRQWTFEPSTLDGTPVDVYYNLTVNFQLNGDKPARAATDESKQGEPE